MLSVLQRAELVTRMAVEVERYIVELGTEGRLIEMQLEETMVGVAADKAALIRDYSRRGHRGEPDDDARRARRACRTRTCSTSAASPSCSATTARLNTLDFPVSPRGYRVLGRIPRLPQAGGAEDHPASSAASRRSSPPATTTSRRSRASATTRAKDIREGLRRLQEVDLVDRYLQS